MKSKWTAIFAAMGMAALIFDSRTALAGAQAGIAVCIRTVIPTLFPFFVLSIMLSSALAGQKMRVLSPLARMLRIPDGAAPLPVIGLLGGYPVGAQSIAQACRERRLPRSDARRMLAFCSNAGPAFIFGLGAQLLPELWMCFLVWGIHILSAWAVAMLTPGRPSQNAGCCAGSRVLLPQALRRAVSVLASVCGWVVLFRILIAFADRWALWAVPEAVRIALCGVLELANGCCGLLEVESIGLRMSLFAALLSFGGLCVAMQTASVCDGVDTVLYLPGKLCQGAVSLLLCIPAQLLLASQARWTPPFALIAVCCAVCVLYRFFAGKMQKSSSIPAAAVV